MIEEKGWKEFKSSGLLWFVNMILHTFGWSIVCEYKDGVIIDVFPARVKFRGFSEEDNSIGYRKVAEYLQENIDEIKSETDDE